MLVTKWYETSPLDLRESPLYLHGVIWIRDDVTCIENRIPLRVLLITLSFVVIIFVLLLAILLLYRQWDSKIRRAAHVLPRPPVLL